jgi:hypothetical protein
MTDLQGSGLPLAGIGLTVEGYADFLAKEYLGDYVRSGGAAVRFVVAGDQHVAGRWHAALARIADAEGYLCVPVDAAETRVHMVDQVYGVAARSVDWRELARRQVWAAWEAIGLQPAADQRLTVAGVAAHHGVDPREAGRSLRRRLEADVLHDAALAREFRLAVLRLCQAELGTGDVSEEERAAVVAWLRVEKVGLRALRSASLFSRLGRHNARAMLVSLAAWRARTAGRGLLIDIDLQRLAVSRRPPVEQREGHYYSKAAVLDAYEVLRQLVDATDQLHGALIAVSLPPELLVDDKRGLPAYSALHLRVVDEVRDRRRPNPFACLVRLETRMEAVS